MKDLFNVLGAVLGAILMIIFFALFFSLPTMWLWNWLIPTIFGITKITWVQALGINVLSGILFRTTCNN